MIRARNGFLVATPLMAACDASGASPGELTIETDTSGSFPVITSSGVPRDWNLELVTSIGPESLVESGSPNERRRLVRCDRRR